MRSCKELLVNTKSRSLESKGISRRLSMGSSTGPLQRVDLKRSLLGRRVCGLHDVTQLHLLQHLRQVSILVHRQDLQVLELPYTGKPLACLKRRA